MSVKQWSLIKSEQIFQKYGRGVDKKLFKLPNGKLEEFYIKSEGPTVSILALTPEQKVIVVEQFRPGPNKILSELPGGFAKEGSLKTQAENELLEETGYKGKVRKAAELWDDAYSILRRHCYVATNCIKVSDPSPEVNEFLQIKLLDLKQFRQALRSGNMTDIECAYLGLEFLKLL